MYARHIYRETKEINLYTNKRSTLSILVLLFFFFFCNFRDLLAKSRESRDSMFAGLSFRYLSRERKKRYRHS